MAGYVERTRAPRTTLTIREQELLKKITGQHRDGFRDHVLLAAALGTGLRVSELVALNISDLTDGSKLYQRVKLRVFKRGSSRSKMPQEVILPDTLRYKLRHFFRWKEQHQESLSPDAPLFCSKGGQRRLSKRAAQERFNHWQQLAGLERSHSFHNLRHTAITNAYREEPDVLLVQRIARHASIDTTMGYIHASDEDHVALARKLPC